MARTTPAQKPRGFSNKTRFSEEDAPAFGPAENVSSVVAVTMIKYTVYLHKKQCRCGYQANAADRKSKRLFALFRVSESREKSKTVAILTTEEARAYVSPTAFSPVSWLSICDWGVSVAGSLITFYSYSSAF
jgi:hypothetical protein